MYANYDFYASVFYGTEIAFADFPRFSSMASDFLDYYTRGKAPSVTDSATSTALSKACCAIAEAMQIEERNKDLALKSVSSALNGSELKSESVGSYSVTYATASDYIRSTSDTKGYNTVYARIASMYLSNTGLLYRGGY